MGRPMAMRPARRRPSAGLDATLGWVDNAPCTPSHHARPDTDRRCTCGGNAPDWRCTTCGAELAEDHGQNWNTRPDGEAA